MSKQNYKDDRPLPHAPSGIPPEVLASLAEETPEERARLLDAWQLSTHYLATEPPAAAFERAGAAIWANLQAELPAEAPSSSPLRLVKAPLRVVHRQTLRWAGLAACIALLLGLGLAFWPSSSTTFTAPLAGRLQVDLPDGSRVDLNSGATLAYSNAFGEATRSVNLKGEAFFEVTKGDIPFIVETFNGETTVLGTSFNVRAWPDDEVTSVTVVTGTVKLASRQHRAEAITLQAGESARLAVGREAPEALAETEGTYALAWRQDGFKFADQPLRTVIREVERRYEVTVAVTPGRLLDERVGILIEKSLGAEQIIRDICEYNGFSYRAVPGGYEIYLPTTE